jgi:hypothetical protein
VIQARIQPIITGVILWPFGWLDRFSKVTCFEAGQTGLFSNLPGHCNLVVNLVVQFRDRRRHAMCFALWKAATSSVGVIECRWRSPQFVRFCPGNRLGAMPVFGFKLLAMRQGQRRVRPAHWQGRVTSHSVEAKAYCVPSNSCQIT